MIAMDTRETTQPSEPAAYAIAAWCKRWGFSVPTFYRLKKKGLMPDVWAIGGRRLITVEAEQEWKARTKDRQAAA